MKEEKKNFIIHALPVLKDNIIWIWQINQIVVVIDPAISGPVEKWIIENNCSLHSILHTHHHDDHIGGTPGLLKRWPKASVIASKSDIQRIPFQSYSVSDEDVINILGFEIKVVEVPGHTANHVAYYLSDNKEFKKIPVLFSGDTLFSAGCGRVFEGTNQQMFNSLKKLNSLPSKTKIYCAHEYTEKNLLWANNILPNDLSIKEKLKEVSQKRSHGLLSLPTSIAEERKINLFLRAQSLGEFSQLRKNKDQWSQ